MKAFFFLASLCILIIAGSHCRALQPTIGIEPMHDPIEPDVFECGRAAAVRGECFPYLSGMESKPLPSCCDGVKMIVQMLAKPEDKLLGCRCLKEASSYFHTIKETAISDLSKACQLDFTLFSGDVCKSYK
ncbi:hypothetical protein AAG906_007316 [Vitis piasezkii]